MASYQHRLLKWLLKKIIYSIRYYYLKDLNVEDKQH